MAHCPICNSPTARETASASGEKSKNEFFPFCCKRCKLLDLGKWASGEYVIAGKNFNTEDESSSAPTDPTRGDLVAEGELEEMTKSIRDTRVRSNKVH